MLKVSLILMLTVMHLAAWGQDDLYENKNRIKGAVDNDLCKSKTDEFTKETIISTDDVLIGRSTEFGRRPVKASISNYEKTFYLTLIPEFYTIQTIREGDIVYLKFKDESMIELKVPETDISHYTSYGTWYNVLTFRLTPEQVLKMSDMPLLKLKCSFDTYEVKKKNAFILRDMIHCIWSKQ